MASPPIKLEYDIHYGGESHGDAASVAGRAMDEQDLFGCISTMLQKEENYLCHDYLDGKVAPAAAAAQRLTESGSSTIDESCRAKMCEWVFHVIDSTRLQRETASVAMNYLDRFLCSSSARAVQARSNRREYQLASMVCLYIAGELFFSFSRWWWLLMIPPLYIF